MLQDREINFYAIVEKVKDDSNNDHRIYIKCNTDKELRLLFLLLDYEGFLWANHASLKKTAFCDIAEFSSRIIEHYPMHLVNSIFPVFIALPGITHGTDTTDLNSTEIYDFEQLKFSKILYKKFEALLKLKKLIE